MQQEQPKEHIRNLTDCGIRQTAFQQFFFICQHGTHKYGDDGKGQQCILHPCTADKIRSYQIICHTDNSNNAAFCDDTGKDGRCRRRCYRVRCRQPCVQREHTRFTAKTDHHQEVYCQQYIFIACQEFQIQCTAGHECGGIAVTIQEEEAHKPQTCAKYGIPQIFHTSPYRFRCSCMDNQRQCKKCHVFIR